MRRLFMNTLIVSFILTLGTQVALAGGADVEKATAKQAQDGSWSFSVTVRHHDEGWKHYVDRWEILNEDGSVLGQRTLYHPHENEQPFTRSLSGVMIPKGTKKVRIRAHDNVHGYSGKELSVKLK